MWKGSLAFGLVSIPVSLFSATTTRGLSFRTLHIPCHTPLQYRKTCPHCEKEVPPEEITRGYEYEKGHFVVLSDEEIRAAAGEKEKVIEIDYFANIEEIDPIYFQKAYYLAPEGPGRKPYALLRRAMEESGRVALASIALHNRQWPAVVRVYGDVLSLSTIYFPDEVNAVAELPVTPAPELREGEMVMARELIEYLATPFAPEKLRDHYRERLLEIIEARIKGKEIAVALAPEREKVVDLLSALQASVEMARGRKEKGVGGKSKGTRSVTRKKEAVAQAKK
ncbi:MAG: Ku protein [Bacillota bacterium]